MKSENARKSYFKLSETEHMGGRRVCTPRGEIAMAQNTKIQQHPGEKAK